MGKTRYFVVWAKYHDTPDDLIDHLHTHGSRLKKIVLYQAHIPGTLTGSAEISTQEEDAEP
jgi:hypothetical protein